MSKQPTAEETVNALVVEIRVLEGTFNELSARQNLLERALIESRAALDAIKNLGAAPAGEVLVQIGGGAMLRSPPPETGKVLISIGSGVVVEKPKDEATSILEGRTRDLEKSIISIAGQRNEIAERLNSDRQILNNFMAQQNEE
ncbi:MAG: prefoldin subunit alpha [archaeon]|nr:MAG: prefoldin subunit alpha [archaeon]